jgi:hypothetical protein
VERSKNGQKRIFGKNRKIAFCELNGVVRALKEEMAQV